MAILGARLPDGDQVVREIGRGAVARVYLVSDGVRLRALKLLPAGQERRARYEHALAHDLDHPHVGRVDAVIEVAGRPGVVMPLVAGSRLVVPVARQRREAFLDTFDDLLSGLAYLHGRGIVHRDVKPENVLVDRQGRARLVDFDLAVRVGRSGLGHAAGTAAYLSPEQARGEPALPASDVYAAGIVLYVAMTGEAPFTGSLEETLDAHLRSLPRAPSSIDDSLARLDGLTERLLAKRPEERCTDGAEALALLRSWRGEGGRGEPRVAGRMAL
jgi:eukaryotic-like serine/threonine-protein kinase